MGELRLVEYPKRFNVCLPSNYTNSSNDKSPGSLKDDIIKGIFCSLDIAISGVDMALEIKSRSSESQLTW